ncbi:MAG: AMP-binding protein [Pseudomonadota bacterium]
MSATTVGAAADKTFPKLMVRHASEHGAAIALAQKHRGIWRRLTWAAFAEEALALAEGLAGSGLTRGGRMALICENRPRLMLTMAAAQSLGAAVLPLFPDATAEEIAEPMRAAQVTHVFAENQEQVDKLIAILPRCPEISCIVYDDDRSMGHYKQQELVHYDALIASVHNPETVRREIDSGNATDPAFLFFTSGAAGPTKGVVLSHGALIDRATTLGQIEGLSDTESTVAYLPAGWLGQTLFSYVQPMALGYSVCCPESSDTLLGDLREVAPTVFVTTPRMLDTIVSQVSLRMEDTGGLGLSLYRRGVELAQRIGGRRLSGEEIPLGDRIQSWFYEAAVYGPLRDALGMSQVKVAYVVGDAVDPGVLRFFRALGVNLKQLYGSTETAFCVSVQRNDAVKPGTVGAPVDGVELSISAHGEVLVRSPGLFSAYLDDPEGTAAAFENEGWFRTGDSGEIGPDGQLRIIDRATEIGALPDGTRFAPRQIENKIKFSPYIREAISMGDGRDGVVALVDINAGAVGRWADSHAIPFTGHADLASRDEVYALVGDFLAEINAELAADPATAPLQIRRFALLREELSADDGVLTRTGKIRRAVAGERFGPIVAGLYGGQQSVAVAASGQDNPFGENEPQQIKLRDVPRSGPATARRAA